MKSILLFLGILLLGYAAHIFMPWWAVYGVALLLSAMTGLRPGRSFFIGFLAAFALWAGTAYWLHQSGEGILTEKIGEMLGGLSVPAVVSITALLGGLLGGFGAWTGSSGRRLLR